MDWWLILLIVIVAIAMIWYARQQNAKAAEQRRADESRRLQAAANEANRAERASHAAVSNASAAKGGGLLQEAVDMASGARYERATNQLGEKAAELEQARQEADRAAERLAGRASEALAAVQAAAAAHGGATPGDGTHNCPSSYPVKGNMPSLRYHQPGQPSYNRTIPEVCFQSAAAAEAAGFTESGDETGMRDGAAVVEETVAEEVVAEAIVIRGREGGDRPDIVAEAIEAADAGGVPPGAVRGDGSRDCPSAYPIKGNQSSLLYHAPGTSPYARTIPEFCFSSADSAAAAGFSPARR